MIQDIDNQAILAKCKEDGTDYLEFKNLTMSGSFEIYSQQPYMEFCDVPDGSYNNNLWMYVQAVHLLNGYDAVNPDTYLPQFYSGNKALNIRCPISSFNVKSLYPSSSSELRIKTLRLANQIVAPEWIGDTETVIPELKIEVYPTQKDLYLNKPGWKNYIK